MSGVDWWAGMLGPRTSAVRTVGTWPGAKGKLHSGNGDKLIEVNITATIDGLNDSLAAAGAASAELERAMLSMTTQMRSLWNRMS